MLAPFRRKFRWKEEMEVAWIDAVGIYKGKTAAQLASFAPKEAGVNVKPSMLLYSAVAAHVNSK